MSPIVKFLVLCIIDIYYHSLVNRITRIDISPKINAFVEHSA